MNTTTYVVMNLAVLAVLLIVGFIVIRQLQKRGIIKDTRTNAGGFFDRFKEKKANPVTGDKTSVIAIVSGVAKNLRNAGERETYYVICNYKDPDSKLSTTFTSRELKEYPDKNIIGKPVKVKVDPQDPNNYTVDIDSIL